MQRIKKGMKIIHIPKRYVDNLSWFEAHKQHYFVVATRQEGYPFVNGSNNDVIIKLPTGVGFGWEDRTLGEGRYWAVNSQSFKPLIQIIGGE